MKCPNCGAEEKTLVKVCGECGEAFVSQDLVELYQLQFMVAEMDKWDAPEQIRQRYLQQLETLSQRLTRRLPTAPEAAAAAAPAEILAPAPVTPAPVASIPTQAPAAPVAAQTPAAAAPAAPVAAQAPAAVAPAAPPEEKQPFDQWLRSERNIKIALYSGGALLVLSGLIFVGVNWARIPGPAKFAITLMITGLMYLAGYLLYQRPTLKLGGVAVLPAARPGGRNHRDAARPRDASSDAPRGRGGLSRSLQRPRVRASSRRLVSPRDEPRDREQFGAPRIPRAQPGRDPGSKDPALRERRFHPEPWGRRIRGGRARHRSDQLQPQRDAHGVVARLLVSHRAHLSSRVVGSRGVLPYQHAAPHERRCIRARAPIRLRPGKPPPGAQRSVRSFVATGLRPAHPAGAGDGGHRDVQA